MGAGDFWNNQEHAQSVVLQVKALKNWVDPFETLVARVTSARELAELLDAEPDAGMDADLDAEIERETGSSVADITRIRRSARASHAWRASARPRSA